MAINFNYYVTLLCTSCGQLCNKLIYVITSLQSNFFPLYITSKPVTIHPVVENEC